MRYFVGFLIAIGLIILLIILLFRGGGQPATPKTSKTLSSYSSTNADVSMLIDGPINSAEIHNQILITVNRDNVTYQQLKGYDGNVVRQEHYANTENSYNVFLHALGRAGFTKIDTNPDLADGRGYCPLGDRFVFRLTQDGDDIQRSWDTSCGKPKTYHGNLGTTVELFKDQVPNYTELTRNIVL